MPFFGNATTSPTAFSRVIALAGEAANQVTSSAIAVMHGTANANAAGGQFEFDLGSGYIRRASHSADINADISVAGPTVNGRDQVAAFTNPSWIYLYAILSVADLVTVGYVWSQNPPATGPTVPSGYGYPVFCGAWRTSAGLVNVGYRRNDTFYNQLAGSGASIVSTATAPVTEQTASLTAACPPTCKDYKVAMLGNAGDTTVNRSISLLLRPQAGGGNHVQLSNISQVINQAVGVFGVVDMPYAGTSLFWNWSITAPAGSLSTNLIVASFRDIPW
jgi:hypothetical protein